MTLLLLVAALAWGQEPGDVGRVRLVTSPDADVVVLPRARSDQIEIGVYGNRVPLWDQLESTSARWMHGGSALSIGGGTWFVYLHVERDDVQATITEDATGWVVSLAPGAADRVQPETVRLQDIVDGTVERRPEPRPFQVLHPLSGDAMVARLNPADVRLELPRWQPRRIPEAEAGRLQSADPYGHDAIVTYREVLTTSDSETAQAVALFRLVEAYLATGLPREAAYYMRELDRRRIGPSPSVLALWRAQAAIAVGEWDEARDRCGDASEHGAADHQVLECYGAVALATSDPPPGPVGALLAQAAERPQAQVLAAQLLLRDYRYAEARDLLEVALPDLTAPLRDLAAANLADAWFALGEYDRASDLWSSVTRNPELVKVRRVRSHLLQMVQDGPATWASHHPPLARMARERDVSGAEALYLMAQVGDRYGDPDLAAEALVMLLDDHRLVSRDSDVPERLLASCTLRLRQLDVQERWLEEVALYERCWRPELYGVIRDTAPIEQVSRAQLRLGLVDQALATQLEVMAIQARDDREDPDALLFLGQLYLESDLPIEAMSTADYIRKEDGAASLGGWLDLLEGDALWALGDLQASADAYRRALKDPQTLWPARPRLAMLRVAIQGCGRALPTLQLAVPPDPTSIDHELVRDNRFATARCLLELGELEQAHAAADAIHADGDPWDRHDAAAIAALAQALGGEIEAESPEEIADHPLWSALLEEERAQRAFVETVQKRRR